MELAPSLLVVPLPLSSLLLPRDPSPFYHSSGLVLPRDTAREEGHLLHHPHGCPRLWVLGDRSSGLFWQGTCPPATPTLQTGTEPDTPASSPTVSLGVNPTCNPHHVPIQEVPSLQTFLSIPNKTQVHPCHRSSLPKNQPLSMPRLNPTCLQPDLPSCLPLPRYSLRFFPFRPWFILPLPTPSGLVGRGGRGWV